MRRSTIALTGLFASTLALAGCEGFMFPGMGPAWECELTAACSDNLNATEPLETGAAELEGDYGRSRLDTPTLASANGWHDPGTWGMPLSTVEVQAEREGYLSMAIVDLYGGLEHPDFATGEPVTYRIEDDVRDSFVVVTGCAGSNPAWWDYDTLAEEVTVLVEAHPEDPGLRIVSFTATFAQDGWAAPFPDGRTTFSGSVEVRGR